jgi:hypothetical protein
MNQIGPVFREARIKSGKTIEDATKETKIARKYLNAIENEDFDVFPGETYLLGFLRNYASFLGLDPDEMVLKYRDYKIQEQPAPIEQLTARPKSVKKKVLAVLVPILVISVSLYVFFTQTKTTKSVSPVQKEKVEEKKEPASSKDKDVTVFEEEEVIQSFHKGDIIEVAQRNKKYTISIDEINGNLDFSIGTIPFTLSTEERVEVDFDRDGRKDLLMRVNQIGEGEVNITLKKLYKTDLLETEISPSQKTSEGFETVQTGPPEVVIIREDDILSSIPVAPKTGFQILTSYEKTDISTFVKSMNTTYFGYIIDDGNKKGELLRSGEELSFTAKDTLRMMIANTQGIKIEINNVSVSLGNSGSVVAKIVRWYRDSENNDLYHLIIDDWEK